MGIHSVDYPCWCVIYSFEDRISDPLFCEFVVNFCSNKHMSASSKVFMLRPPIVLSPYTKRVEISIASFVKILKLISSKFAFPH